MKKTVLFIVTLLSLVISVNLISAQEPYWASLVNPDALGGFQVHNHTDNPIWLVDGSGNQVGGAIAAHSTSASRFNFDNAEELPGFCSNEERRNDYFRRRYRFGDGHGTNVSELSYPCSAYAGDGSTNTSSSNTSQQEGNVSVGDVDPNFGLCGYLEPFSDSQGTMIVLNRPSWFADPVEYVNEQRGEVVAYANYGADYYALPIAIAFVSMDELRSFSQTVELGGVSTVGWVDGDCIYPAAHSGGTQYRVLVIGNGRESTVRHEVRHALGASHGPLCPPNAPNRFDFLERNQDACG